MSAPAVPEKIPQPHGGALYRGGVVGNRGNRMRKELTGAALELVAERMPILAQIADGTVVEWSEDKEGRRVPTLASPTPSERVKAMSLLWEVANGEKKVNLAAVRARFRKQIEVIRQTLPPDDAERLLAALAEVWK